MISRATKIYSTLIATSIFFELGAAKALASESGFFWP